MKKIIIGKDMNLELYNSISEKISKGETDYISNSFEEIKNKLKNLSCDTFERKDNDVVIKGTDIVVPSPILKKLKELENEDEVRMLGLLRFWIKLQENPDKDVVNRLYGFVEHCNVPITVMGDMLLEKGVGVVKDSYDGHLVDLHTRTIKNDIGTIVEIPREKVNPDSSKACESGLHVAGSQYVRDYYGGEVIVECLVDPRDVCAVPERYEWGKMRVCRYKVVGYSDKNDPPYDGSKIVKLDDYLQKVDDKYKEKVSELFEEDLPKFEEIDFGTFLKKLSKMFKKQI